MRFYLSIHPFLLLLFLSGCTILEGPKWSPDGQFIAFSTTSLLTDSLEITSIMLVAPALTDASPALVCEDGGFPQWQTDGPALLYLGARDKAGFFTKVFKYSLNQSAIGQGSTEIVYDGKGIRFSGFQLSFNGKLAILLTSRDMKPQSPKQIIFWNIHENKTVRLTTLGDVYSPALSPNGRLLAYAKQGKNNSLYIACVELDRPQLEERLLFPTPESNDSSSSYFQIMAMPDNERFLFYGGNNQTVWTAAYDGSQIQRFSLPPNYYGPLAVSIADDGASAVFTLVKSQQGQTVFDHYQLSFRRGQFSRIGSSSKGLEFGFSVDPKTIGRSAKIRWAWINAAGLSVGTPSEFNFFCHSKEQQVEAARRLLSMQKPDSALQMLKKALAHENDVPNREVSNLETEIWLANGEFKKATEVFLKAYLLYPVSEHGLAYVLAERNALPLPIHAGPAGDLKSLKLLVQANPDDSLLATLTQALGHRFDGNFNAAIDEYRKAETICNTEELVAGVRFLAGLTSMEAGMPLDAGESWESVARSVNFPQTEFAIGLAAIAYALDGRPDSLSKANRILQMGKNSALRADLDALPRELRNVVFKDSRLTAEVKIKSSPVRVWIEVEEYFIPQASTVQQQRHIATRETVDRNLGVLLRTHSALQVAGASEGTNTVLRIPHPVSQPVISPSGEMIAFTVQGEIFPAGHGPCEVFVVDLTGNLLLGERQALKASRIVGQKSISALAWTGPRELNIQGISYDALGNSSILNETLIVNGK